MPDMSREQIVELVTREVLKLMGDSVRPENVDKSGLPCALLIGSAEKLPVSVRKSTIFAV